MDGLEPIHEAQERDRKDPFLQRSVPLESNPGHLRTNDSPAKELTAGRSVRKRARARSRSAQNPENPPFEARALKQPLGSTVALQRSAAGFALEIAASLIMSPQTESRRARAGTASKVGVVNVPACRLRSRHTRQRRCTRGVQCYSTSQSLHSCIFFPIIFGRHTLVRDQHKAVVC